MKHKLLVLPAVLISMSVSAQSEADTRMNYFSCDFDSEFSREIATYDEDGHELHFTMVQSGFDSFDSWTRLREEGTENYFAASASYLKKVDGVSPGPVSDWMVLPPVWIRGDEAVLSWDSRAINEQSSRPSTYSVYVSTEGNTPSSFKSVPLASFTEEESSQWTHRSVDVSSFCGQRVWIAFVNDSDNGEILGIDNISVDGAKGLAELTVSPGRYVLGAGKSFNIGGTVTAYSGETVDRLTVECEVEGRIMTASYENLGLGYLDSFSFEFPEEIKANFGESVDYTVRATVNTTEFDPVECTTTVLAFLPHRNVVIEEVTGMWCQYCPKGIVAFEVLEERYPENFIGIAVHMVEDMDPMALDDYATPDRFSGGAPSGWIDRKLYSINPMVPTWEDNRRVYTTLKGGFETLLRDRLDEQALAEASVSAVMTDAGEISVDVQSRFPVDFNDVDFRLAIAVTEDHVWEDGYFQYNVFSGGGEIIGGFESLPGVIRGGMEFNHVARAIYDDYDGIPESIPSRLEAGEVYSFSRSFPMPAKTLNPDNLKVIAMIIDRSTGEVMNSAATRLVTAGVKDYAVGDRVSVDVMDGRLAVVLPDSCGEADVMLYDMSGRLVGYAHGAGSVEMNVYGFKGAYILKVLSPDAGQTVKLMF